MDRISQLPDEIIHRILYRINSPKWAAKTSTLSRRWLHLWRSYPVLEFLDYEFQSWEKVADKLRSFAAASFKRLQQSPIADQVIVRMTMSLQLHESRLWADVLENSSGEATLSPIEIDISYASSLSNSILSWNLSRTKVLKLYTFNLDAYKYFNTSKVVRMERLEVLDLRFVRISSDNARALFTSICRNSPNLEKLILVSVQGLKTLHISSNSLKFLEIYGYVEYGYYDDDGESDYSDMEIHIASAPLLHTLSLCLLDSLTLEPSAAPNLKVLELGCLNSAVTQSYLDRLLSNFPSPHSVSFVGRSATKRTESGLQSLRISSSTLRELRFNYFWLRAIHVDAPNLVSLHHDFLLIPHDTISLVNVAPSCRCVFELAYSYQEAQFLDHRWFRGLRDFLATLTQSHPHLRFELTLESFNNLQKQVPSFQPDEASSMIGPPLMVQHLELGAVDLPPTFDVAKGGDALLAGFFSICALTSYPYLVVYPICILTSTNNSWKRTMLLAISRVGAIN